MSTVYVGGDASKGYADFHAEGADIAVSRARFDDTAEGHGRMLEFLRALSADQLVVGLEASGGVERNWLHALKQAKETLPLTVYQVNPLVVHKFRQTALHHNVTDPSSAKAIAQYLKSQAGSRGPEYDPALAPGRQLLELIQQLVKQRTAVKNQLQALIVTSHPELVRFARTGLSDWLLRLLAAYPTQDSLRAATVAQLVEIPYVTKVRAQKILDAAQSSVASDSGPETGLMVGFLAAEIRRRGDDIDRLSTVLAEQFAGDPLVTVLQTIPGVGVKTAVALRLVIGNPTRFRSCGALVAYCGLDPRIVQSGDGCRHLGISRRGNSMIRSLLYMSVLAASRGDNTISAFRQRLEAKGKSCRVAIVACMGKMLRIAYACMLRHRAYDASYKTIEKAEDRGTDSQSSLSLDAPVSRHEARRRKQKAAAATTRSSLKRVSKQPQTEINTPEPAGQEPLGVLLCGPSTGGLAPTPRAAK